MNDDIVFGGRSHSDIIYNGLSHYRVYLGDKLIWEKSDSNRDPKTLCYFNIEYNSLGTNNYWCTIYYPTNNASWTPRRESLESLWSLLEKGTYAHFSKGFMGAGSRPTDRAWGTESSYDIFKYKERIENINYSNKIWGISGLFYYMPSTILIKVCKSTNLRYMTYAYAGCQVDEYWCGDNVVNMAYAYESCKTLGPPMCGSNVINMSYAYCNCRNLTGSPMCGDNVVNMYYSYYNCRNLTGSPVCGSNVVNMSQTYYNCNNLTGSPMCGDNVINMSKTYYYCTNLTGSPVCGSNVVNMSEDYEGCRNLTGSPVCGSNVIDMTWSYAHCTNLTGSPVCGSNVVNMSSAYRNCFNLTGSPVCGDNVVDMSWSYYNCSNLRDSIVYIKGETRTINVHNAFRSTPNVTIYCQSNITLSGDPGASVIYY